MVHAIGSHPDMLRFFLQTPQCTVVTPQLILSPSRVEYMLVLPSLLGLVVVSVQLWFLFPLPSLIGSVD